MDIFEGKLLTFTEDDQKSSKRISELASPKRAKSEKTEGIDGGTSHSTKSKTRDKSPKRDKSEKSPKSSKKTLGTDILEGELLTLITTSSEDDKKSSKRISELEAELLEERSSKEAAVEDLTLVQCHREVDDLRPEIEFLNLARVEELQETAQESRQLRESVTAMDVNFSSERESLVEQKNEPNKVIQDLEKQVKSWEGACYELERKNNMLLEQHSALDGLSSRRLGMLFTMETQLEDEKALSLEREMEFQKALEAEQAKTAAALHDVAKYQQNMAALENEIEQVKSSRLQETEDFLQSVDDLKKQISTLEEEKVLLLYQQEAASQGQRSRGVMMSHQQETGQRSGGTSADRGLSPVRVVEAVTKQQSLGMPTICDDSVQIIAELEEEVKKVKKNRKVVYVSAPAASEMSVHQALETSQKERQKLEGDKHRLVKLNQN
jgi:hypothetical protein